MNIALFIRSLNKGGAEKQAILLTSELKKSYTNVHLIVLYKEGDFIDYAISKKINIYFLNGNFISKSLALFTFLRKQKINVILNFLPVNNILGIIIGKLAGVKYCIGGIRGSQIKNSKTKMILQKWCFNYLSNGVISNSYCAKKSYSDYGIISDKIKVIHNFIEVISPPIYRNKQKKINILSIGRFTPEKDYTTAFNSIATLLKNPLLFEFEIEYTIIGYGKLESIIRKEIQKAGLINHVKIINSSVDNNLYLSHADIFLLTSNFEGMPNTIMEAMEYSLPIVTTDVGDVSYIVFDNENGFICPQKDNVFIANRLYQLVVNKNLRTSMGEKSYEIISRKFSSSNINSQFAQYFNQLI